MWFNAMIHAKPYQHHVYLLCILVSKLKIL